MEINPLETGNDKHPFAGFIDKIQSKPPGFISGGNSVCVREDKNSVPISLKKEKSKIPKSNEGKDVFLESEKEGASFESFLMEADPKPTEPKKEGVPNEQDSPFMISFLVELVHNIKNTLASIYQTTSFTLEKVDDAEMRNYSHIQVKDDIKTIDSVLNSLLNFINVTTAVAKTNTLYTILDEVLEANEGQLQEKDIKIIKQCEKDLPETYIHNEQVRFILHSILQYAIFSALPHESIGFLMKSFNSRDGMDGKKTLPEIKGGYVEVVIGFNGGMKLGSPLGTLSGVPGDQKEEPINLILKLAKEILQKNHGRMMVEANGKTPNTLLTLRFPLERRKVVYYAPITL